MNTSAETQSPTSVPGRKAGKKGFFGSIGAFFRWFWRNKRIQVIFLILVISLPVFMIIYGIVLPAKNYQPSAGLPTLSDTAQSHNVSMDAAQMEEVRKIIHLENERVFLKNRLSLAEKDSVYFILDLADSMLWLEIRGVPVRKTKIAGLEVSNRFSLISHESLLPWITEPFTLQSDLSTIPKMPIVIKQAPKDTIEAAKASSAPLPLESTPVFFTLYFDRNLILEFEQAEPVGEDGQEHIKSYKAIKRKESNRSVIETLRNPQQSNRLLPIRIVIPEKDARAIYRAIPSKTHLIVKF